MNHNIIQEKSYRFALKIIELYRSLLKSGVERILIAVTSKWNIDWSKR